MKIISKTLRISGYLVEAVKYFVLCPIAWIFYRKRQIHIFAERGDDARDNGYYMYCFYRRKHPEIESYYVITKRSADREKVMKLGNVVNYRSLKHYLLFIAAEYKISTHIMGCSPNVEFYTRFADKLRVKGHRIFLQHGIISSDLPMLYKNRTKLDIFICGAKTEYDYVSGSFGYANHEVKYTGLARYDGLHDIRVNKQILCMPTWRKYLKYGTNVINDQSEYVKRWNALINNQKLISALKNNELKLFFYPHYEMQKHISLFKSMCDEVIIANFKDYDVQKLLKESQLLITDYSSVFYDFAYMGKPTLYYQFDKEQYFAEHYAKGYFDYETMGFGQVVEQEDDAVNAILSYINNFFEIDAEYKSRINNFFLLRDSHNCERIYFEIEKL